MKYHLYRSNTESVEFLYLNNLLSLRAERLTQLGWEVVGSGPRKLAKLIRIHDLSEITDDPDEVYQLRKHLQRLLHNNPLFSISLSRLQEEILVTVTIIICRWERSQNQRRCYEQQIKGETMRSSSLEVRVKRDSLMKLISPLT